MQDVTATMCVRQATPTASERDAAKAARLKQERDIRCEQRRQIRKFRKEGTTQHCIRCKKGPMHTMPDGLVYGCEECGQPGDKIHGSDPLRDYCVSCGMGLPAAKITGAIMFDRPGDP